MLKRQRGLLVALVLLLCAAGARATIGPPVQVRIVGPIPEFVPGERRIVTIEIATLKNLALESLRVAGKGWTVHSTTLPVSKAMSAGEKLQVQVDASTLDAGEPLTIRMTADGEPFEHAFDLSPAAAARSRGPVPGRADPGDPGAPRTDLSAKADAPGDGIRVARNIRVFGKVWTERPDAVVVTAANARVEIWEDDVDPNPDDFIVETATDANGNFDVTFFWDAVSEAEPDLYFVFLYENSNVRVQDGNGFLYGYSSTTTANYAGTSLNMGTWYPAAGFEPTGFLFSLVSRGSEILWLSGGATEVWSTPKVNCQWFPGSANGPDYNGGLIRMSAAASWYESDLLHEFGHHWHRSFANLASNNYCNAICDTPLPCGHCLWCNEDLGSGWNEGLADYLGEWLPKKIGSVFGPAPYSGAGSRLYNFESIDNANGNCPAGHVPNPVTVEGYVAALLRDIDDTTNDNDPSIGSGIDQLGLSWEEILKTVDLDDPSDIMDFLARFNTRYNQYQSQLVQTALNNGFQVGNSKANWTPYLQQGWAYPALPRAAANTLELSAPVSPTLDGNANSTWLNMAWINAGGFPALNAFTNRAAVDGITLQTVGAAAQWNGTSSFASNRGPHTITGGRHTATMIADASDAEAESNESDNEFGRQWIWTPLTLPLGITTRNAPPARTAGWSSVPAGSQTLYGNCDGFRLTNAGANIQAVAVKALDNAKDYDLSVFTASTGSQDGFGLAAATSAFFAGSTDFILVNYHVASVASRDFGVLNLSPDTVGQFQIERTDVQPTTTLTANGQVRVHGMLANQIIQVGEVFIPLGGTGSTYLQVDVSPVGSPVRVAWYDAATGVETRGQATASALTDAGGRARLFLSATENTWAPFAIYRDPAQGTAAVTVTLTAGPTPAELATSMAVGSFGPVVPRDNTLPVLNIGDPIVAPTLLVGDQTRTNVYVQLRNTGPRASLQYDVSWLLDGITTATFDFGTAPANSALLGTAVGAFLMSGGRHTQGMFVDSGNNNTELDETNNRWAAQWIWAPAVVGIDAPLVRSAPPAAAGGWGDVPAGTPTYENLDALRTPVLPTGGARYAALAILPTGPSDHDLYLHELSTGPQNGFILPLANSRWVTGASDYVLANFGVTSPRAFDAAIQRWFGTDDYRVQLTQSVDLGTPPISAHDATMPGSAILHLYEVQLSAEPIEIRLENQSGTVNWGLTVHAPTAAFDGKTSGLGVVVDANGDGGGELTTFTAPVAGRYAIAVWKAGSSDNGKAGQYRLKVLRTATDVADAAVAPRTSAITGVVPNPFNPRTTIAFDVAASGMVSLQLFDLLGKHVRTLEEKSFAAGHHEVAWDGMDDTGHRVASGVYFVRMSGTGASSQRKMVLLK